MRVILTSDPASMGNYVARAAGKDIRAAITRHGKANIVVATGASQFEVLAHLIEQPDIDWECVTGFHLDEYVGLSSDHPASFCKYLKERFVQRVPLAEFHFLRGDEDPAGVIDHVGRALVNTRIDLALVGIGENGHLAFNDPPADFDTNAPYLIVQLDEPCRTQQVGEGWFDSIDDVPTQAISMSVRQIMKAKKIYCSVPDLRKATAVAATIEGPVDPSVPASILRHHDDAVLVVDKAAASELTPSARTSLEFPL